MRDVAEHVKRGVWEAGGLPVEFPVISLGETQMRPTAMLFRNLLAMDIEESIRGNPVDAVVLLGGCDKTTPGQLMGAASVDLPTIVVSSGPMLNGKFRGRDIGSGTDVWKFSEAVRAGRMSNEEFHVRRERHVAQPRNLHDDGQCIHVATSIVEAMGIALPFNATAPAVDARRRVIAHEAGRHDRAPRKRRCATVEVPRPPRIRERDPGARGDRGLDECRAAPARDRGPSRRSTWRLLTSIGCRATSLCSSTFSRPDAS